MSRKGRVIVALSGGVDSSVAACLLKEQGYDCLGVFMRVGPVATAVAAEAADRRLEAAAGGWLRRPACCSAEDALDARAVAGRLGIPLYVLDFQAHFERVIEYFVAEYARGRTPNPCVICNTDLKFGHLLRYADTLDAEFVATGHYARIIHRDGHRYLARAVNRVKDQSYVLFGVRREHLGRCLFPLGQMADKATVRQVAADLGLRVHDKPDSQEICFVPDGDYRQLVRTRRPQAQRPGPVVDSAGKTLGTHEGIANYTIGQRHGLGVAAGVPLYVTGLDAVTNTVLVGPRAQLLSSGLVAEQVNWLTDPPPAAQWLPATVQIRHRHTPACGGIRVLAAAGAGSGRQPATTVEVRFDQPQSAVTPGQAAVFYDRDEIVLGGGWIVRAMQTSNRQV